MFADSSNIYEYNPNIDFETNTIKNQESLNYQNSQTNIEVQQQPKNLSVKTKQMNNITTSGLNFQPRKQLHYANFQEGFGNDETEQPTIIETPTDKIKNLLFYYLMNFFIPLMLFIIIFVIFSLDFVKDGIFNIIPLNEVDEDGASPLSACIVYGLIIGVVFLLTFKLYNRIFIV